MKKTWFSDLHNSSKVEQASISAVWSQPGSSKPATVSQNNSTKMSDHERQKSQPSRCTDIRLYRTFYHNKILGSHTPQKELPWQTMCKLPTHTRLFKVNEKPAVRSVLAHIPVIGTIFSVTVWSTSSEFSDYLTTAVYRWQQNTWINAVRHFQVHEQLTTHAVIQAELYDHNSSFSSFCVR